MVMWVAAISTCTANAVESPPRPCGPDAQRVHRLREARLERRRLRDPRTACRAAAWRRAWRAPRTGPGAADAHADDRSAGRSCRRPRARSRSTKRLDRVHALGRDRHLAATSCSRSRCPSGIISIVERLRVVAEVDVDRRHAGPARGVLVLARDRMHDRGAQRMLARRALAAAADRALRARRRRPRTPRPMVTL